MAAESRKAVAVIGGSGGDGDGEGDGGDGADAREESERRTAAARRAEEAVATARSDAIASRREWKGDKVKAKERETK